MSNVSGVIYELNDTINTFESKVDVHVQNTTDPAQILTV